jgi:FHA domain
MMKRVVVHGLSLLVGVVLGIYVAQLVHEYLDLDPLFQAIVVAAFIFLLQVVAYSLGKKLSKVKAVSIVEPPTRGSEMWGWLKPASGFGTGFPLTKEKIRVGRGVEMDIMLNNASISRKHAEVSRLLEGCLLRDIGSRNGVFVNGERVKEQMVSDGDLVGLGDLRFIFHQVSSRSAPEVFAAPSLEQGSGSAGAPGSRLPSAANTSPTVTSKTQSDDDAREFDETAAYSDDRD